MGRLLIIQCFWLVILPCAIGQISTISIQTDEEIPDEPKVSGTLTFTGADGEIISSNIGIEIRGGFSQTYPKKTYDIEFWNDPSGTETVDVQFGSLRKDDDWVLDAMYNEPLRINSYITHKMWLKLNQLYYKDLEPKAKSGADVMYVKVHLNGEYQGIYLLSEQIDRNLLRLKRNEGNEMRGELYKGYANEDAVFFNDPGIMPNNNSLQWSGYEYRYPTDFVDWSNAYDLIDFVANSSDEEFEAQVANRFDIENLMDYFILLNVARILDNRGKNIYLCRYDEGEPYFLAPWDLDGSWGLLWNGENDTTTKGALSNNLFDRLIENDVDGFKQKISDKWFAYRQSFLSDNALEETINEAHQFLLDNDIYAQEEEVWDYNYSLNDLNYMFDWLEDRLIFLDDYFGDITSTESLNESTGLDIFPNPAFDILRIQHLSHDSKEYSIYNLMGVVVMKGNIEYNQVDIRHLPAGTYILDCLQKKTVFQKL